MLYVSLMQSTKKAGLALTLNSSFQPAAEGNDRAAVGEFELMMGHLLS